MRKLMLNRAQPRARAVVAAALALVVGLGATPAAFAAGATPTQATPVQREEAQTRFAHGHDLFAAKKFDEARDEFEKSYAIVASPNALLFLARCDRERGKLVAAYAEYGRTVAEAKEHAADDPRYAKTSEAASEERDAVGQQLAFVTIAVDRATAETTVTVAGEKFDRAEWGEPVPVAPGKSEAVVTTPGKADVHQALEVAAGEHRTLALDAGPDVATPLAANPTTPPPTTKRQTSPEDDARTRATLRTGSYVAAGAGVVGFATFAVFGLMSNATYNDLSAQCHGPCAPGQGNASEISKGKTQQTVADVGLAVGLVGTAATVVLFVMSLPTKPEDGKAASASPGLSIMAGPTWMGVQGAF
jgi:hypothetical protein